MSTLGKIRLCCTHLPATSTGCQFELPLTYTIARLYYCCLYRLYRLRPHTCLSCLTTWVGLYCLFVLPSSYGWLSDCLYLISLNKVYYYYYYLHVCVYWLIIPGLVRISHDQSKWELFNSKLNACCKKFEIWCKFWQPVPKFSQPP